MVIIKLETILNEKVNDHFYQVILFILPKTKLVPHKKYKI